MIVYRFKAKENTLLRFILLSLVVVFLESCVANRNTNNSSGEIVISDLTTDNTSLSKSDLAKYFCNNLTEYFNTNKFYKISSEIYNVKEKQKEISITKTTKQGSIYTVEYIGCAGRYVISFSNKQFPEANELPDFGRFTLSGNAIRSKVYDTFSAWINRMEIALKAYDNSYLFITELDAAIEVEKWYNSLSTK